MNSYPSKGSKQPQYQKKNQKKPKSQTKKVYVKKQPPPPPLKIPLAVANFNVLNHLHLNQYTKFEEDFNGSIQRYIYSISILLKFVNTYLVTAVSLSEVTDEYYHAFNSLMRPYIENGSIKVFYQNKSLMTVFFDHPWIQVNSAELVEIERDPERDRLQIFNIDLQFQGSNYPVTFINIHGYGLPQIREQYLTNTFIFIDQLRSDQVIRNDFLCTGDFNSDWEQVFGVLEDVKNQNYLLDLTLYENHEPTSYHRYIVDSQGKFNDKPQDTWYTKMDHLLFTNRFEVANLVIVPHDFTTSEHPYQIIDEIQYIGRWPSDHTLNVYNLFWSPQK